MPNSYSINERIFKVLEYSKLSKSAFAQKLNISLAVMSHLSANRNKPNIDMVSDICEAFPQISAEWLLLGKGNMLKDAKEENLISDLQELESILIKAKHQIQQDLDPVFQKLIFLIQNYS